MCTPCKSQMKLSSPWSTDCVAQWPDCVPSIGRRPVSPVQDHLPIAQIPALLDHVQNVGLPAGASQARKEEDCRPGGRVGVRDAVIVVKPIQRDLPSICCLNKLTGEKRGTNQSSACATACRICLFGMACIGTFGSHLYTNLTIKPQI